MKATKLTLTVQVEVLSVDVIPHMLSVVEERITNEFHNGSLTTDDGDTVAWSIKSTPVEF